MRIILLAGPEQKEEMLEQIGVLPPEVTWAMELDTLDKIPNTDACIDLLYDHSPGRLKKLEALGSGTLIINSVLQPLDEISSGCIRINGWSTFLKRTVVEAAGNHGRKSAELAFSIFNKKLEWVNDIVGFISARIVASVINEAWFALEEKVTTRQEIDTAMKLGTNYPYGPFEWSEKIGLKNIWNLLQRLSNEQSRYQPCRLLTNEAAN